MKSIISNDALHSGFEDANVKFVFLLFSKPKLIPFPSLTFCLALFFPSGSNVGPEKGFFGKPQELKNAEKTIKKSNFLNI